MSLNPNQNLNPSQAALLGSSEDNTPAYLRERQIGADLEGYDFERSMLLAEQEDQNQAANLGGALAITGQELAAEEKMAKPEQPEQEEESGLLLDFLRTEAESFGEDVMGLVGSAAERDQEGFAEQEGVLNQLSFAVEDVVTNVPRNAGLGTARAINESFNAILGRENANAASEYMRGFDWYREADDWILHQLGEGRTTEVDEMIAGFSQFAIPFMGWTKALMAGGASPAFAGITAEIATSFFNIDPHIERFADLAKEMGLQSEFVDFMASDTADENHQFIDRTKNVFDNLIPTAVIGAVFPIVKGSYRLSKQMASDLARKRGLPGLQKGMIDFNTKSAYQDAHLFFNEAREKFLNTLPEGADFDDVIDALDDFTPEYRNLIKALDKDDWLGFDYPAQALDAVFSNELNNFEPSQGLKAALGKLINSGKGGFK